MLPSQLRKMERSTKPSRTSHSTYRCTAGGAPRCDICFSLRVRSTDHLPGGTITASREEASDCCLSECHVFENPTPLSPIARA